HLANGKARLLTRSGQDWSARFPTVVHAAAGLPAHQAILDGEVVILLRDGRTSFQALQNAPRERAAGELVYFVFDLLSLGGRDLRTQPLERRKELLAGLLRNGPDGAIRYCPHVVGGGEEFQRRACRSRLEGIVSKLRSAPYRGGRTME